MHVGAKNSAAEDGKSIADIADCMIGKGLKRASILEYESEG